MAFRCAPRKVKPKKKLRVLAKRRGNGVARRSTSLPPSRQARGDPPRGWGLGLTRPQGFFYFRCAPRNVKPQKLCVCATEKMGDVSDRRCARSRSRNIPLPALSAPNRRTSLTQSLLATLLSLGGLAVNSSPPRISRPKAVMAWAHHVTMKKPCSGLLDRLQV